MARIAILQGHPDPDDVHLCHALADAYAEGAREAGHEIRRLDIAKMDIPFLRSKAEYEKPVMSPALRDAQKAIGWAEHLVIVYPLWLGTMPALLKAFLEQVLRPGFAFVYDAKGTPRRRLNGRSARVIVTMGMPAIAYRWFFFAHGLRALKRSILGFVGFKPVRDTLFGMVEGASDAKRKGWLAQMRELGRRGS
jgi:putative NADPH-quinone reductase